MSVAFEVLQSRLQAEVPATNDLPSEAQYRSAVTSAVADFAGRLGNVKRVTLPVTAGTATYELPPDFLSVIRLEATVYGDVYLPAGGQIVPLSAPLQRETYTVAGRQITFYPTPLATIERTLVYKAGHVLDESQTYPDMTDEEAELVLIKARANLYRYLSMSAAPDGWRYQIGDVMVDKSNQTKSLSAVASTLDTEYRRRINDYIGPAGGRS
jgi:hypothetical protein